ncbi:hypothetical protein PybrP1_002916 [[Pythium] brassicae (nom. inval.)]|nr:hypothetical protein PybrP1_002916 [[Pythium] brassicae (nom. inval.)]
MTTRERAELLKLKGNQCFQKGKLNAAIDMYTEAIVLNPTQSTYYSNRALCHSKLEHWASCRDDCVQALKCDALNAKASYLLGSSHVHLRCFDEAFEAFRKALASAEKTSKSKAFQHEIVVELRRAKKTQWQYNQTVSITHHEAMKAQLAELFRAAQPPLAVPGGPGTAAGPELDALMAYMESLAVKHERDLYPGEIPEYFVCPVSMEIMVDPVTTPNGISYERKCLEEHLRKNGPVDPLTRKQLTFEMLRPNTSLRAAIQDFLEKNPWAFEH